MPKGLYPRRIVPTEQRFWAKVDRTDTCWLWIASTRADGYGNFWDGTRQVRSHRWAYEHFIGPIPESLQIDHLCRVRACCNPLHLEPVTPGENIRRGRSGANYGERTHCKNGHEFTAENTIRKPHRRICRTCNSEGARRFRERRARLQVAS